MPRPCGKGRCTQRPKERSVHRGDHRYVPPHREGHEVPLQRLHPLHVARLPHYPRDTTEDQAAIVGAAAVAAAETMDDAE